MVDNLLYPPCIQHPKTVEHVVWNCCAANDIWAACSLPIHKWQWNIEDIHHLWDKINTSLLPSEVETSAIILRQIWLRRNVFVFYEILYPPHSV